MPRTGGLEVARPLRSKAADGDKNAQVKIIAASRVTARKHSTPVATIFVPNPFQEGQLLAALGRALELEWVFDETIPPTTDHPSPAENIVMIQPSEGPAMLDALLHLSRRGNILGLRRQLHALLAAKPTGVAAQYLHHLEPLVAAYQMNRIRDVLLELKQQNAAFL